MNMNGFRFIQGIALLMLTISCFSASAQTVEIQLHVDNNGQHSGCEVNLASIGSTLEGIDVLVTATVDRPSKMITSVTTANCAGGSFAAPGTVGGNIPLGLNNGTNGSDVVEIAVPLDSLWHAPQSLVFYTSAENLTTGGQDLAGVAGDAQPPVETRFYIAYAIPAIGWTGLLITGALLLFVGLLVLGKKQYVLAVSLLSLASICFAAGFIADGQVGDWDGATPNTGDPAGDAIPSDPTADIQAVFLALEGGTMFARVDITDLENVAPEANDSSASVLEDETVNITLTGSDVDGASLSFVIVTPPAGGSLGVITPIDATSASVVYTPGLDFNGADSFTFKANDGIADSLAATVDVTVTAVNDQPSFTVGANQDINEDAGVQSVSSWATGILAGPADEAGQVLSFNASNDNNLLFSVQPSVNSAGDLSYTPADDANGTALVTIDVMDDGGTANGGDDTSPAQTFTITVNAINDVPEFTAGANEDVSEDAGAQTNVAWATGISAGPADEAGQVISFNVSNDNNALFSVQPSVNSAGDLSYTPAGDAQGLANVTIEVMDDGGTANGGDDTSDSQVFTITVNAINDIPAFAAGTNVDIHEDAGAQTISSWATGISAGPADEAGQVISFIVSNDNNALFSIQPSANSSGDLSFTPADDANGLATVTISAMDDGGTANGGVDTSAPQTFTITVNAVNDAPVFAAGANQGVNEDAGAQIVASWATGISAGPADEAGQVISFNVSNDNNALFSVQPSVNGAGELSYTPADESNGLATVTISAMDDGGTANGGVGTSAPQTFTITVNAVNDVPSFAAGAGQTVDQDSGAQTVPGWATAISAGPANEAGQTVSFNLGNDNGALFSAQPAVDGAGTLTFTPAAGAFGVANVSIAAMDDGGTPNGGVDTSAPQAFTITVVAANTAPVLRVIGNQAIDEMQLLSFTALADDSDLPAQTLTFSLSGAPAGAAITAAGLFTWTPTEEQGIPGAAGMYTFDVQVSDDGVGARMDSETITVTVNEVNQNPVAVDDTYASTGNVGIDVAVLGGLITGDSDPDLPAQDLSFTAETVASAQGGSASIAADGSFTYTPPAGYTGPDTFVYTLNDALAGSDTGLVTVTVADMIWFIDNSAIAAGNGTLAAPFNTLAGFEAVNGSGGVNAPAAGSCIFIDNVNAVDYTGPLTLENTQVVIGKGAVGSVASECGVTLAGNSNSLPATGGTRPLVNSSFNGINLALDNTVRGLNIGNTEGPGMSGSLIGSPQISLVSVLGTGPALGITASGVVDGINFDTLQCSTGSTSPCVNLVGVTGTLGINNGGTGLSHSGTGANLMVNGGSVNLAYPATISKTSGTGAVVSVIGNQGTVTLSGTLSASVPAPGGAFIAKGGGTLNVTGANNTISTTTNTAIEIDGTTIGNGGVTFKTVSVSGGSKGIVINNAGVGGFSVTGDGATAASGGTIQNISGRGIDINSTDNVSLSFMDLTNTALADGPSNCTGLVNSGCAAAIHLANVNIVDLDGLNINGSTQIGINGLNVVDFTLGNSLVTNAGDEVNEGVLQIFELTGTSAITNSTLSFPSERVAFIKNSTGTLDLTISGSIFSDSQSSGMGADGLEVNASGTAAIDLTIDTASQFVRNRTNGLQVLADGDSAVAVSSTGSSFDRETGIGLGVDLSAAGNALLDFDVTGSPVINGRNANAFNSFVSGFSVTRGRLDNNSDIQVGGPSTSGLGVRLNLNETATATYDVSNNTISNIGFDAGIQTLARGGTGRMDAQISGNSVAVDPGGLSLYNIWVHAQDNNTLCANVISNSNTGFPIAAFRERTSTAGASVFLQNFNTSATVTWNNNGNTPADSVSSSNNGTLGAGTCTTVPVSEFPFD